MAYTLGQRSLSRLEGVHPHLVEIVEEAITLTSIDFCVLEGLRSIERQKVLYEKGASRTMNSRHLTGHAVDLGAWIDNEICWAWPPYYEIANAMMAAASKLNRPLEWGGGWEKFRDGVHYQLPFSLYPRDKGKIIK